MKPSSHIEEGNDFVLIDVKNISTSGVRIFNREILSEHILECEIIVSCSIDLLLQLACFTKDFRILQHNFHWCPDFPHKKINRFLFCRLQVFAEFKQWIDCFLFGFVQASENLVGIWSIFNISDQAFHSRLSEQCLLHLHDWLPIHIDVRLCFHVFKCGKEPHQHIVNGLFHRSRILTFEQCPDLCQFLSTGEKLDHASSLLVHFIDNIFESSFTNCQIHLFRMRRKRPLPELLCLRICCKEFFDQIFVCISHERTKTFCLIQWCRRKSHYLAFDIPAESTVTDLACLVSWCKSDDILRTEDLSERSWICHTHLFACSLCGFQSLVFEVLCCLVIKFLCDLTAYC